MSSIEVNTLFIKENNAAVQKNLIDDLLKQERVLVITKENIYNPSHLTVQSQLKPQDKLLDDIGKFVSLSDANMILDAWDEKINTHHGQDAEGLLLSLLGSFTNNILTPRCLVVDCFDDLSANVRGRILDIVRQSKSYGIQFLICCSGTDEHEFETLVMNSNEIYIPKMFGNQNKIILSILTKEELVILNTNETYIKRIKESLR